MSRSPREASADLSAPLVNQIGCALKRPRAADSFKSDRLLAAHRSPVAGGRVPRLYTREAGQGRIRKLGRAKPTPALPPTPEIALNMRKWVRRSV